MTRDFFVILSYLALIGGSMGMVFFATRFPFSTKICDLKHAPQRLLGLNGCQVWVVS